MSTRLAQLGDSLASPHAPDPKSLWLPFGLLGSKSAIEALGLECSAIPEEAVVARPVQPQLLLTAQHAAPGGVNPPANGTSAVAVSIMNSEQQNSDSVLSQDSTPSYATLSAQLAAMAAASVSIQGSSLPMHEMPNAENASETIQQTVVPKNNAAVPSTEIAEPPVAAQRSDNSGHSVCSNGHAQSLTESGDQAMIETIDEKDDHVDIPKSDTPVEQPGSTSAIASSASDISAGQALDSAVKAEENPPDESRFSHTSEVITTLFPKAGSDSVPQAGSTGAPESSNQMQVEESGIGIKDTSLLGSNDKNLPGSEEMETEDCVPSSEEGNQMDIDATVDESQEQPSTSPQFQGSNFENPTQVVTADALPVKGSSA